MSDEASKPIAEELVKRKYKPRTPVKAKPDKFDGFRDRVEDWVPEPPEY